MAHLMLDTGSPTLGMSTNIHIVSPCDGGHHSGGTLYLLHGAGDNASTWQRLTTIELYAQQYGCTVIMPQVNRSYYNDMEYGLNYFHYVTRELPALCNRLLRMETAPEKTYVGGLSMGGYGALKCALTYPEQYSKAFSLSGVTDIEQRIHDPNMEPGMRREMQAVFGPELEIKPHQDLYALAEGLVEHGKLLPSILTCCGSEDPFISMNREFAKYMNKSPYDYRYVETSGTHEWRFWERHLATAFEFLFGEKKEVE